MERNSDIREFLVSRRAKITPEQAGLPAYGTNRRVQGLRREEVAMLAGISVESALIALGVFAGAYALYGGLKAVALTDIVQVSLLVMGGLVISYIALNKLSGGAGVFARGGFLGQDAGKNGKILRVE